MFDIAMADFARLDPRPSGAVPFSKPEHTEGLTVLAGPCPWPHANDTLFLVSLLQPKNPAAVEYAESQAADLNASLDALADQALAACDERQALDKAYAEYQPAKTKLAELKAELADVEQERADLIDAGKDPAKLRKKLNEAKQAVEDAGEWEASLAAAWREAKAAMDQARTAKRQEFFDAKGVELTARRDELRKQSRTAIEAVGRELLAIEAMTKALGARPKPAPAPVPRQATPAPARMTVDEIAHAIHAEQAEQNRNKPRRPGRVEYVGPPAHSG
jgi:hypothetical protein